MTWPRSTDVPAASSSSVEGLFDADGYRALSSDVVAHLVFTHQTGMTNLLTRASWEARAADPSLHPPFTSTPEEEARVAVMMSGIASEVVDYLLFIDETKLTDRVRGGSGFAERFSKTGPRDRKGRSLYELDLNRRLMKYPCSYLIYSPAFDALPPGAKDPIYRRMWQVLSGEEQDARVPVGAVACGPSGHRRNPARHQEGPSAVFSERNEITPVRGSPLTIAVSDVWSDDMGGGQYEEKSVTSGSRRRWPHGFLRRLAGRN